MKELILELTRTASKAGAFKQGSVQSLYPDVTVVVDNLIEIKQNCKKAEKQSKSYEEIVS